MITVEAIRIDRLNAANKSHWLLENNNLFNKQLFHSESDMFRTYTEEIKENIAKFIRLSEASSNQITQHSNLFAKVTLEQIEQQISAVNNALKANDSMHNAAKRSFDLQSKVRRRRAKQRASQVNSTNQHLATAQAIVQSSHQLYQQLNEHHDFERRLEAMVRDRENLRAQCKPSESTRLSSEVLALHQRLGRCRKAISDIEKRIEISNRNTPTNR